MLVMSLPIVNLKVFRARNISICCMCARIGATQWDLAYERAEKTEKAIYAGTENHTCVLIFIPPFFLPRIFFHFHRTKHAHLQDTCPHA